MREQKEILTHALGELTSLQRKPWIAAEIDGLSYAEAAARIGVPEATFTVELYRPALAIRLRETLRPVGVGMWVGGDGARGFESRRPSVH